MLPSLDNERILLPLASEQFLDLLQSQGRGRLAVDFQDDVLRPQTRLRVRYPKSGKGSDTDSELEVWRSFFALHEFKPVQAENPSETVMELVD